MRYERSKAPLALMEQIIMILVFALTAAVCLEAFVYANNLSVQGDRQNLAANHAQEVVEYCKATMSDNLDEVPLEGERTENGLIIPYTADQMDVSIEITEQTDWLVKAKVRVQDREKQELFSMNTAWQKGGPS